jgi:hypothetical protein
MEFLKALFDAQAGTLLIIFGMTLLLLAIVGAVKGKVSLDDRTRLIGGALGLISLAIGVWLQTRSPSPSGNQTPPNLPTPLKNPSHSPETPLRRDRGQSAAGTTKSHASGEPIETASSGADNERAAESTTRDGASDTQTESASSHPAPSEPVATAALDTTKPMAGSRSKGSSQTCRINPKPWRWTTIGQLIVEVDSRQVGVINVGPNQSGFDFACIPGDHSYLIRSNMPNMSVACTGGIVFSTNTTTLDLLFSQPVPGPPKCSLAVTLNQ